MGTIPKVLPSLNGLTPRLENYRIADLGLVPLSIKSPVLNGSEEANMAEVIIAGEAMTLPMLAGLQEQLLTAFRANTSVILDASQLVRVDIGFIQLIAAARAFASGLGVSLALAAPVAAPVEAVLRRAGFLGDPASDDTAFWL